ncbi:MAG: helix-turn-helix domain-containing protein [Armatimonadota bacterium]
MSSHEQVTITVHIGKGAVGRLRKRALEALARDAGALNGDMPSLTALLRDLADTHLEGQPLPAWFTDADAQPEPQSPPDPDEPPEPWTPKVGVSSRFAELLEAKRAQEGAERWTLAAVSQATGLDVNTLRGYYRDTFSQFNVSTLEALCEFLDCGVGDLLALVEEGGP